MPYDPEKSRLEREQQLKKEQAEMALLCAELENILHHPDPHTPAPTRHADILDCLFYTVMRDNLRKAKEGCYFNEDRLNMALRIQKHAMDMAKTDASINYMNGLVPPAYLRMTPTPLLQEQTIDMNTLAGADPV